MKPTIAVLDCTKKQPALGSFAQLVEVVDWPLTYHLPAVVGLETLAATRPVALMVLGSEASPDQSQLWQDELADYLVEALSAGLPVYASCFGHELLAAKLGSSLRKVSPVAPWQKNQGAELTSLIGADAGSLGPQLMIGYNHSVEIETLGPRLVHTGEASQCRIAAMRHAELPLWSFQGHPELDRATLRTTLGVHNEKVLEKALNDGAKIIRHFVESMVAPRLNAR